MSVEELFYIKNAYQWKKETWTLFAGYKTVIKVSLNEIFIQINKKIKKGTERALDLLCAYVYKLSNDFCSY